MTGEPLPVHKRQGSTVYAGTVLEEGSLVIQTAALAGESRIQQIVGLIENSEALKAGARPSGWPTPLCPSALPGPWRWAC